MHLLRGEPCASGRGARVPRLWSYGISFASDRHTLSPRAAPPLPPLRRTGRVRTRHINKGSVFCGFCGRLLSPGGLLLRPLRPPMRPRCRVGARLRPWPWQLRCVHTVFLIRVLIVGLRAVSSLALTGVGVSPSELLWAHVWGCDCCGPGSPLLHPGAWC